MFSKQLTSSLLVFIIVFSIISSSVAVSAIDCSGDNAVLPECKTNQTPTSTGETSTPQTGGTAAPQIAGTKPGTRPDCYDNRGVQVACSPNAGNDGAGITPGVHDPKGFLKGGKQPGAACTIQDRADSDWNPLHWSAFSQTVAATTSIMAIAGFAYIKKYGAKEIGLRVAKTVGSKILSRAIPYVGWALLAVDIVVLVRTVYKAISGPAQKNAITHYNCFTECNTGICLADDWNAGDRSYGAAGTCVGLPPTLEQAKAGLGSGTAVVMANDGSCMVFADTDNNGKYEPGKDARPAGFDPNGRASNQANRVDVNLTLLQQKCKFSTPQELEDYFRQEGCTADTDCKNADSICVSAELLYPDCNIGYLKKLFNPDIPTSVCVPKSSEAICTSSICSIARYLGISVSQAWFALIAIILVSVLVFIWIGKEQFQRGKPQDFIRRRR